MNYFLKRPLWFHHQPWDSSPCFEWLLYRSSFTHFQMRCSTSEWFQIIIPYRPNPYPLLHQILGSVHRSYSSSERLLSPIIWIRNDSKSTKSKIEIFSLFIGDSPLYGSERNKNGFKTYQIKNGRSKMKTESKLITPKTFTDDSVHGELYQRIHQLMGGRWENPSMGFQR